SGGGRPLRQPATRPPTLPGRSADEPSADQAGNRRTPCCIPGFLHQAAVCVGNGTSASGSATTGSDASLVTTPTVSPALRGVGPAVAGRRSVGGVGRRRRPARGTG